MGKQKYPTSNGVTSVDGERQQRDNTKTGKLAQRRATRRLEAIERQVRRIQNLETELGKDENKKDAQRDLAHAQLTLQQIRGETPHAELRNKIYKTNETTK